MFAALSKGGDGERDQQRPVAMCFHYSASCKKDIVFSIQWERMNDIQILTIGVAVVVPFLGVMLGVLINNTRLNDVKELLRAEIHSEGAILRKEMAEFRSETRGEIAELRLLIEKQHSEVMAKLIDMDNRILRLESQRLVQ